MDKKTEKPARKWYQKKRYLIPVGIVLISAFSSSGNNQTQPVKNIAPVQQVSNTSYTPNVKQVVPATAPVTVVAPEKTTTSTSSKVAPQKITVPASSSSLSNDNYYTNVDGNTVHSPAYSNSVPSGASAQCRDGTYSFSQHRSGTCSGHGGVARWL